jgi:hypothetical protein
MIGAKSLCVLLAAVTFKANKALLPYIDKCYDICHILLYLNFFFHIVQQVRVTRSKTMWAWQ